MRSFSYYYVVCPLTVKLEGEPFSPSNVLDFDKLQNDKEELGAGKNENWENLLTEEPGENPVRGKLCSASIFIGVRLETLLYSLEPIRRGLGLFTGTEVQGENTRITKKLVRNFFDAAAIDAFSSAYATFELRSGTAYPAWGNRHKTYLAYDAHKSFDTISEFLYSTDFVIRGGTYKIVQNSVKERRARRGIKTA